MVAASVWVVAAALGFGFARPPTSARTCGRRQLHRVAAVSVDAMFPGYARPESAAYRDVAGTVQRYQPHIDRAIATEPRSSASLSIG